ncbi:DNA polymerase III subunit beta [Rhodomicrobium lacus]|uniref:DNA polymerase III subunit beta n=1 Tax=Rhodomicrobium lacus TaxID=2498452 RepID=UPI000F8EA4B5|nr:DNA polymerase III subunit beta [Rhodomicrobium lacus]
MPTISARKSDLSGALTRLSRVVEKRNTIPILSNFLLTVDQGKLTVTATDLDLEARTTIDCSGDLTTQGGFTVPAGPLSDIVRKLPDGDISLSWDGDKGRATVKAGRSRFELMTLPAEDFPEFGASEFQHSFTAQADALATIFDGTSFAMSSEETRYYLNGVYLHTIDKGDGVKLRGVATDGHRLSSRDVPAPDGASGMPGIIVPRKCVGEIVKLAKDVKEIAVDISPAKIRLTFGTTTLTSKLVDGSFPDYQRVIPASNKLRAVVDNEALAAAADRVSLVSSEKGRAVKLSFGETLRIEATDPERGSAADEVDLEEATASPVEIGFNARYLADTLANLPKGGVSIALSDGSSPTLFQPADDADSLLVLMPMRV